MNLYKASRQWSSRPDDQRFTNLQDLYTKTKEYATEARQATTKWSSLRVEAQSGEVVLVGKGNVPANLTHWAFGQLASKVKAPAAYLRELPATLAAQNLNHGLANKVESSASDAQLLFHKNGSLVMRAITSDIYSRIWNYEVAERLLDMQAQHGFVPANECKLASWTEKADAPLFASDHDMFAFVANPNAVVAEAGTSEPLFRGFIVENSEVGASALKLTKFLYRFMCGNLIIWGASQVVELSVRHVGDIRQKLSQWDTEMTRYANESVSDEEAMIASAKRTTIAATKEEVLDKIFSLRQVGISRKTLEASYDAVVPSQDGNPNTVWGFVQGVTRHSQTFPHADTRVQLDRAAGRIMQINF